jgi:hypothetical protein
MSKRISTIGNVKMVTPDAEEAENRTLVERENRSLTEGDSFDCIDELYADDVATPSEARQSL